MIVTWRPSSRPPDEDLSGAPSTRTLHGAETIDGHSVSPGLLEPGARLWELRTWRCVFIGTAVQLYAGEAKVASVYAHGRREVESIGGRGAERKN
jgi:hypothetical protein